MESKTKLAVSALKDEAQKVQDLRVQVRELTRDLTLINDKANSLNDENIIISRKLKRVGAMGAAYENAFNAVVALQKITMEA